MEFHIFKVIFVGIGGIKFLIPVQVKVPQDNRRRCVSSFDKLKLNSKFIPLVNVVLR